MNGENYYSYYNIPFISRGAFNLFKETQHANLGDSDDKEDERDDRYAEQDGGQAHANNVGDDEEQGGHQPWQQEPTLS